MSITRIERKYSPKNLNAAFFPVEKVSMTFKLSGETHNVSGYKALVDTTRNRVLSTVTDKYKVVTNNEAYMLMKPIAQGFFGGRGLDDFECFNLHIPKSRASCRIDLTRPNPMQHSFDIKGDKWTAFIRINNSYNRTSRLVLRIGYCRWICLNGVIFGANSFTLAIDHSDKVLSSLDYSKRIVARALEEVGDVGEAERRFTNAIMPLTEIRMSTDEMCMLFCRVYGINLTEDGVRKLSINKKDRLVGIRNLVSAKIKSYCSEFNETAYAALNILTDYASFPNNGEMHPTLTHGYQTRVGNWVSAFSKESKLSGFSMDSYFSDNEKKSYELFKHLS